MQTATNQKEPILAREGLPFYIIPVIAALIFFFLGWERASGLTFLLALAIALFFRNPRRYTPSQENLLISPADGTLICCGEANAMATTDVISDSKIPGQKSKRISIFLSVLDVHVNRYPCMGKVESTQYHEGKFLAAFNDKASLVTNNAAGDEAGDLNGQNFFPRLGSDQRRLLFVIERGFVIEGGEKLAFVVLC
jgi:phosphatidylserine decarboxylase